MLERIKKIAENNYRVIVIIFFIAFLIIGLISVGDYGFSTDEGLQYDLGNSAVKLLLNNDRVIYELNNRYHGTAFTLIMTIIQRNFDISDTRTIFLLRHYFTFLLFFTSVILFYFLCRNIFKSWKIGLLGSIFLVLSPRIFVDAFYNPKDLPFLSMFVISIFTLNRFLEKGGLGLAFFHGIASGFACSMRIVGVLVPFFTILFLIFELVLKKKDSQNTKDMQIKKRIQHLLIYLLITIIVFLVLMPSIVTDPIKHFFAAIKHMSDFPHNTTFLYMGQVLTTGNGLPWHYLPVNILIMTPIPYTILFFIGIVFLFVQVKRKNGIYYNANKYIIIAVLWFLMPVLSAIFLSSNMYNGWRQMYFVYPAFLIIGLNGVKKIYGIFEKKLKPGYYNIISIMITGLLLINIVFFTQIIVRLHPYEYVYHNMLAGKDLKEVKENFILDYWALSYKDGFEYILRTDNRDKITFTVRCAPKESLISLFPEQDRNRLKYVTNIQDADYFLNNYQCGDLILESQGVEQSDLKNKVYSTYLNGVELLVVYKLK